LIFAAGALLSLSDHSEARAEFERARLAWDEGQRGRSIDLFEMVASEYPDTDYAIEALWELGSRCYGNLYDFSRAISYFETLAERYPASDRATESLLLVAEIQNVEFQDPGRAIDSWEQYLEKEKDPARQRPVMFWIGDALFQLADLAESRQRFEEVAASGTDQLSQKAYLRIGTVLQLQKQYQSSLSFFEKAIRMEFCPECRLQGQLGMIESLEYLGDLPRALELAQSIETDLYPAEMKEDLLARLNEKKRYYEPRLWIRRRR
jgi:TolA-binding protein